MIINEEIFTEDKKVFILSVEANYLFKCRGKLMDMIKGTEVPFNIDAYKKELGKPYSKLDLYLCKSHDVRRNDINSLKYELLKPF